MTIKGFALMTALMTAIMVPALSFADGRKDLVKVDQVYKSCMDKATSNVEMKDCTYTAYQQADAVLNASYRAITGRLKQASGDAQSDSDNKEILRRLVTAERAWITFRDADCDLQATEMLGGTGESLVYGGCEYDETVRRVNSLESLLGTN